MNKKFEFFKKPKAQSLREMVLGSHYPVRSLPVSFVSGDIFVILEYF